MKIARNANEAALVRLWNQSVEPFFETCAGAGSGSRGGRVVNELGGLALRD